MKLDKSFYESLPVMGTSKAVSYGLISRGSFKTFWFVLLEKKFFIELIWVSPIPSKLSKSSIPFSKESSKKFLDILKCLEISFSVEIFLLWNPSENLN